MSSAKRYLVGSLLVAAMVGLSGASWAGESGQNELDQAVMQQSLTAELTQQVNTQQQQQMSQLQLELQASMTELMLTELERANQVKLK